MDVIEKMLPAAGLATIKAVRVHHHGGPAVLTHEEISIGQPGPYEVRVRNKAVGLNFVDIYFRNGAYTPPVLPFIWKK